MAGRRHDVMRDLIDAVVGGEYVEGEWLPSEPELQRRFGVSRGMVRDALRGLEERRLVQVHPGRGQRVLQREHWDTRAPDVLQAGIDRGPDRELLAQTIEARTQVERVAAELACARAADADFALLAGLIAAMERTLEPGVRRSFDAADPLVDTETWFHRTLVLLSDNPMLAKLVEPLHLVLAQLRRLRAPERDQAAIAQHRRIVEGLSSRDPDLAAEAIDGYGRLLVRWLDA